MLGEMSSVQLKDPTICPWNLIATVIILPRMMTGTQETLPPPPSPGEVPYGFGQVPSLLAGR